MATPSSDHTTRRWVATLIAVLLLARLGSWVWRTYFREQRGHAAAAAVHRKVQASHAFDNALLRADALLRQGQLAAASHLLDSLRRLPPGSVFAVERHKLRTTQRRLDSVQKAAMPQQ